MISVAERALRRLHEVWKAERRLNLDTFPGPALGLTHYPSGTVFLHENLTFEEWLSTLVHELTHLQRDSRLADDEKSKLLEEIVAEHETVHFLVPNGELPPHLDCVEPAELAARLGVDVPTVISRLKFARIPFKNNPHPAPASLKAA